MSKDHKSAEAVDFTADLRYALSSSSTKRRTAELHKLQQNLQSSGKSLREIA